MKIWIIIHQTDGCITEVSSFDNYDNARNAYCEIMDKLVESGRVGDNVSFEDGGAWVINDDETEEYYLTCTYVAM